MAEFYTNLPPKEKDNLEDDFRLLELKNWLNFLRSK